MALITPGPMAGQISGRLGAIIFAHNRGGPYVRNGTIPITSTTVPSLAAKARLAAVSQSWGALTAGQRLAWKLYGMENPSVNRLGHTITLTGHQIHNGINARLLLAGNAVITAPTLLATPPPLLTFSITGDIGAGTTECAFTATPVAALDQVWLTGTVQNSSSIVNVENQSRFIAASAVNQATAWDYQALIEAVFGSLVVGQHVTLFASVFGSTSGLLSAPLRAAVDVTTT